MQSESADEMSLWIQHIRGNSVDNTNEEELKNRLSATITNVPPPSLSGSNIEPHPVSPTPQQDQSSKKDKKRSSSLFSKKKKSGKSESKLDS